MVAWAVATLGSLFVSIRFLRDETTWATYGPHRLVRIGLAGGLVSVAALVVAGIASAAGFNPHRRLRRRLIVAGIPAERLASKSAQEAKTRVWS